MLPGLDLKHHADLAQPLTTASEDLGRDLSDLPA